MIGKDLFLWLYGKSAESTSEIIGMTLVLSLWVFIPFRILYISRRGRIK